MSSPMSLQATDKITQKTLRNERIRLKMSAKLGLNFKLVFHQLYMGVLMIDYSYYLAKQILPPIERLCAPIDCTDSARIAECLGFDPRQFRSVGPISPTERTIEPLESQISDEERFRDADQLFIKCISCSESHPFTGISSSKVHISCFSTLIPGSCQCSWCHLSQRVVQSRIVAIHHQRSTRNSNSSTFDAVLRQLVGL